MGLGVVFFGGGGVGFLLEGLEVGLSDRDFTPRRVSAIVPTWLPLVGVFKSFRSI